MRKSIGIIMGGYSSEYKISLKSGNVVYDYLDNSKFDLYRIHILKEKWVYVDDKGAEYPINRHDFSIDLNNTKITFDCVFNAIHGTPGEDGLMQAYFQLLGIPQTSCGFYQAALTVNKRDLLSVLKPYRIKSAPSYYLNKGDAINEDAIIEKVKLPCFVKANKSGSSYGISKVYKKEECALKEWTSHFAPLHWKVNREENETTFHRTQGSKGRLSQQLLCTTEQDPEAGFNFYSSSKQ